MGMTSYKKAQAKTLTTAMTVDDGAALYIVYTGDADSAGGYIQASTDSDFYLYVGTDSDDSTATDATIDTDHDTDAVSSDGVFNTDWATTLTMGEVAAIIDYSPNWSCRLVGAFYNDGILSTDGPTILENLTDATEITRANGLYIDFDKSAVTTAVDGTDGVSGETGTDFIQNRLCFGPEWDTTIDEPLVRRSDANDDEGALGWDPQPSISDMSTTRTTEGPVYKVTDTRAELLGLQVTMTATDASLFVDSDSILTTDTFSVAIFSASQTETSLLKKFTQLNHNADTAPNSDTLVITKTFGSDDLAGCISQPGERLVAVVYSSITDLTLGISGNAEYGDWDAFD